ncbi:MAG TPA: glutathione S-transferase family protein [Reyranella sp.]|nr:glutathione S-transferase family protein [Reyranella sp.]
MILIGVNRSPYTRRVAITLEAYGLPYEQRTVSGFGEREEVRRANPLGRIPALVLDDGETLVDSSAIVDHLDEAYGGAEPLTPRSGAERRSVMKVTSLMLGACDKALQAAYHRNHIPVEKRHQPWFDDCLAQACHALAAVDAMVDPAQPYLLLGRLTQADITAYVAERLARFGLSVDTARLMPRLRTHACRLAQLAPFSRTEP